MEDKLKVIGDKVKASFIKNNIEALEEVLPELAPEFLAILAEKTENKLDDQIVTFLQPHIGPALKELITQLKAKMV